MGEKEDFGNRKVDTFETEEKGNQGSFATEKTVVFCNRKALLSTTNSRGNETLQQQKYRYV